MSTKPNFNALVVKIFSNNLQRLSHVWDGRCLLRITSWRNVSLTMICPLQLLKISRNKLVICHFWILKVTAAHQVFLLFLVLAMHWSSKCIGEAERDVPSYASTFGRSVIYAIMHSALCTPSLPPQSPIFAIMHGKPGLFTSCQFLPRIPPGLKTEQSKLHQRIRNLTKEVKIALEQTTNPINRQRVALNNILSTYKALHQNHNKSSHLLTNSRVCYLKMLKNPSPCRC